MVDIYMKNSSARVSCASESLSAATSVVIRQCSVCLGTSIVLLLSLGLTQVLASEYSLNPSFTVSEEYTDNVAEGYATKRSDYITRIQPGFAFKYNAPLWDWDLGYTFDYRVYSNGSQSNEMTHNGNLKGLIRIIDEKMFLEVSDSYKRVSLDVTRDTTNESLYSNQTDQNVGIVSPYFVLHPTPKLTLRTGYRYINTWYDDPVAVNKEDHVGYIKSSYEMSPYFFLTTDYTFTREIPVKNSGIKRHEVYIGPRYEYADKSFIYAQGGFIVSNYDSGTHLFNPSWNAGITHSFETITANLSTGMKFSDDPLGASTLETFYRASLTKNLHRGTFTLQGSYTEFGDANSDKLKNKRYSGGFANTTELMQDLNGTLGLTYENYQNLLVSGTTDKYFVECGLNYSFGKGLTAGLYYKYIDYSSDNIFADNYQVNRVILEVKKVF